MKKWSFLFLFRILPDSAILFMSSSRSTPCSSFCFRSSLLVPNHFDSDLLFFCSSLTMLENPRCLSLSLRSYLLFAFLFILVTISSMSCMSIWTRFSSRSLLKSSRSFSSQYDRMLCSFSRRTVSNKAVFSCSYIKEQLRINLLMVNSF